MAKFEQIIGLEIHVQLKTKSKMFCGCRNNPDEIEPNRNICEICTGQPGVLPVVNREAIRKALMVGLALDCEIPEYSKFDRKNYFYPDLPKGYQISQFDQPVCAAGKVTIHHDGKEKEIRITRAHLEEDAGKLIHDGATTLVDLNRAGVPLQEIVTEPDFRLPSEAKIFLQNLRNTVRYLGVSDADMEKGHLRCDANISLRSVGEEGLPPYKIEIKNLNSFKAVEAALHYEIKRQTEALEAGETFMNQTRGWDDAKGITVEQRTKEAAHDYRYFPEPDLPIMRFLREEVEAVRVQLPELPHQKAQRFGAEFGLAAKDIEVLINDKSLASYFEDVVSELMEWFAAERLEGDEKKLAKLASNWISGDLQAMLKESGSGVRDSKVSAENLAELIKMIHKNEISTTAAKKILEVMFTTGGDPSHIAEDEGLGQVSDEGAIAAAVDKVISENEKVVADYRSGKKQALGFLVGKVMAEMKGKANPKIASKLLADKLG
ncbi:MAG: glutaminyl-tRNA synthase (glutamine-hydrolyzing) subunit B [Candidatus Doudnabacteria bacterium RIFCSPHIGHO2_02_FULL_48_21]|uniref:Aspartyl/glutamyl-tRNA(Asn/Gln) amidotransferase subunit B n=1 Tax=Candidatus Doudnabacteria bacterium RIFCSPLOWO2_02_FULL_48_13 TaxID=1817845 RepID=A0A1F5Q9W7_9BACT|nr:MAG: glutaminyl-tRNA synthase (glutamine-hydrolyzing) subunit B [Candidatus Doudnabacteria bacterium RIFCSPHIGHO2_01_48_18]OGE78438.1 MAG: glutaminyl-tRNA synthase (glutamine-hydrolyzing) subunit B [Candidatus Doudnabacteria bacterium RIFCSPHIGHO2_01_FULL_48_180]OGE91692.1 MAG: glutaminyl-tRNA synthase (glutamine-hydrolyzing) subunit B [Candidatus Doudnabacteria bacterium RIFCSPHIGHO2_12_FULL_47_25]OGE93429.1 MAG: glutaminyl-tRNA synthase (glutamine-hydrolyzing) subunit B [Candidatus Doudnaba